MSKPRKNLFEERYLNRKVKVATKFVENTNVFFVYHGILTGIDSNFIYLSNVKVFRNGYEEVADFSNIAINKTLISYITAEV